MVFSIYDAEHSKPLIDVQDIEFASLVPKNMENLLITSLLQDMQKIQSVTMKLQKENLKLYEVRILFDALIFSFPSMKHYLSSDAIIVHSKAFEKAVVGCVSMGFDCLLEEETSRERPKSAPYLRLKI